ncbi:MAG: hypothetical protein IPL78_36095 [Chloroflexi bacterium]|nr:hypothetical protein [Chloroflexota bacterium]
MSHANLPDFTPTVAAAEIQPQQLTLYQWGERRLILTRLDGQIYAFAVSAPRARGTCPLALSPARGRIDCPDPWLCA